MSINIDPSLIALVKELGMTGVALYALYVMNGLQKVIQANSDVIKTFCGEFENVGKKGNT